MKIIKRNISKLAKAICIVALVATAFFALHANQPSVAHAHECSEFAHTQGYSEFSDPFDVIVAIEEELQE